MYVLDAAGMRALDARESAARGAVTLMRLAGRALARAIPRYARSMRVVALAGAGNNGGDAFAAFAELDRSWDRTIYAQPGGTPSPARADAEARAQAAGVRVVPLPDDEAGLAAAVRGAGLVLDGLLGVGARLPVKGTYARALAALEATGARVLAIDVPTGVDATTGIAGELAVKACATVTLGAVKVGLLLYPAREHVGDLWYGPIGTLQESVAAQSRAYATLDAREFLALFPRRTAESDKRSSGAPLVVAGSEQFPGAPIMCAHGAARAGAGYVTVAAPAAAAPALRMHLVEQVVVTWDERDVAGAIETISHLERSSGAIAIGPGLGLSDAVGEIARTIVANTALPVVADASMLFHLSKRLDILRGKAAVLTPHANEFARLSGGGTVKEEDRRARLRSFVAEHGVTTLLKGAATLIDDGTTIHVNPTGTPALATAGTGDVLTGIIGTLLSSGLAPVDAARVGAYWHGLAGSVAASRRSVGVMANDLPGLLAAAHDAAAERAKHDTSELIRIV